MSSLSQYLIYKLTLTSKKLWLNDITGNCYFTVVCLRALIVEFFWFFLWWIKKTQETITTNFFLFVLICRLSSLQKSSERKKFPWLGYPILSQKILWYVNDSSWRWQTFIMDVFFIDLWTRPILLTRSEFYYR